MFKKTILLLLLLLLILLLYLLLTTSITNTTSLLTTNTISTSILQIAISNKEPKGIGGQYAIGPIGPQKYIYNRLYKEGGK